MTEVVSTEDIVYATTAEGVELKLDLHRPDVPGPVPAVLYLHGGAWMEGDKSWDRETRLLPVARHGLAVLSVNYRLRNAAVFPAQLHDVNAAIRWVRAVGATYGLAPSRVGVWGASAGATLGSLAALTTGDQELEGAVGAHTDTSSTVDVVVHWFAPIDLVGGVRRSGLESHILAPPLEPPLFGVQDITEVADRAAAASPIRRVHADAPPFLIEHGDHDRVLPERESEAFHSALVTQGVDATYVRVGGAGHEGAEFDSAANLAVVAAFLKAHL